MIQFIRANSILKVAVALLFCFAAFAALNHHHDEHSTHDQGHCVVCHAADTLAIALVSVGVMLFLLPKSGLAVVCVPVVRDTLCLSRIASRAPPAHS